MGKRDQEMFVQSLMDLYEKENFILAKITTYERLQRNLLRKVDSEGFDRVDFSKVSLTLLDYREKLAHNHAAIVNAVIDYFATLDLKSI